MCLNPKVQVSYTITMIGYIVDSTLKLKYQSAIGSLGMQSLKRNVFDSLFRLLSTICNFQQLRIPWKDFLNQILACNDNGPR